MAPEVPTTGRGVFQTVLYLAPRGLGGFTRSLAMPCGGWGLGGPCPCGSVGWRNPTARGTWEAGPERPSVPLDRAWGPATHGGGAPCASVTRQRTVGLGGCRQQCPGTQVTWLTAPCPVVQPGLALTLPGPHGTGQARVPALQPSLEQPPGPPLPGDAPAWLWRPLAVAECPPCTWPRRPAVPSPARVSAAPAPAGPRALPRPGVCVRACARPHGEPHAQAAPSQVAAGLAADRPVAPAACQGQSVLRAAALGFISAVSCPIPPSPHLASPAGKSRSGRGPGPDLGPAPWAAGVR